MTHDRRRARLIQYRQVIGGYRVGKHKSTTINRCIAEFYFANIVI